MLLNVNLSECITSNCFLENFYWELQHTSKDAMQDKDTKKASMYLAIQVMNNVAISSRKHDFYKSVRSIFLDFSAVFTFGGTFTEW